MSWLVRKEGSPEAMVLPTASAVAEGLRDGNWEPTDEVKGPRDTAWQRIEDHPVFAEVAAGVEPPKLIEDDTTLDMNPLIDVCLVLLIFFILTITYASLERAIAVPPQQTEDQGPATRIELKDIRDRVFVVTARMDLDRTVVKLEKEEVPIEQLTRKMKELIDATGRRQMVLDADKDVPWGVITAILDAAKGNGVHEIINNTKRR
jgi:biopolymer transport protein ExbD